MNRAFNAFGIVVLSGVWFVEAAIGGPGDEAAEFAKKFNLPKAVHESAAGIDLFGEDPKVIDGVKPLIETAMRRAEKWLGQNPLKGVRVKIIITKGAESFDAILKDSNPELVKTGAKPIDDAYVTQAKQAGACTTRLPAMILMSVQVLGSKQRRDTRVIHDLGHLVAGYLISESGNGPPALVEGVAGELVRTAVPKPEAIVCSASAALKDTVQGYGVFSAIGSVANNTWNDPACWPRMLQNVVKLLKKPPSEQKEDKEGDSKVKVSSLLARKNSEFRRADYGFAWSACSYLFDATPPPKPKDGTTPLSRRDIVINAISELKKTFDAAADDDARVVLFRDAILKALGMSEDELQKSWLEWGDKLYSKS
ncbi:MAG: hypothetical protein HY286_13050 [Planctomycetes bacterium]|nr:hypothetical protein [Planctomycetota bacterium]